MFKGVFVFIKNMKKVGIIGGFGPKTTLDFVLMLISMWKKNNKGTRPELLIWNAPIDESIESEFIQKNINHDKMFETLKSGAQILEDGGADFLVLPCNSLHIFIKKLRSSVNIPILSIVEVTESFLKSTEINKISVLGTTVTTSCNLFGETLNKLEIENFKVCDDDQKILDKLISSFITNNTVNSNTFNLIVANLKSKGVKNFLLACTDLHAFPKSNDGSTFIDTLSLLAEATIDTMLQQ